MGATESIQQELDVRDETYEMIERRIIRRLKEYRTIDADIKVAERQAKGIGLVHEMRITAAPPEQDYQRLVPIAADELSDDELLIVRDVQRHVSIDGLAYADSKRVAKRLRQTHTGDEATNGRLNIALKVLAHNPGEEYVDMNSMERVVEKRLAARNRAQEQLDMLTERREIINLALGLLHEWYPTWHDILWLKYVRGEKQQWVINNLNLTEQIYRDERRKAILQFDKWSAGLT